MIRLLTALTVLATLAACAAPQGAGGADGERVVGTVRVAGSAPVDVHVIVESEDGDAVRVVGARADEIARLAGARVAVRGRTAPSDHPITRRQIDPIDYEILAVNGEPVIQGIVEGRTAGWTVLRTIDGELVYLASVPETVRTGDRIWVQGQRAMVVQSYGVVRPR